MNNFLVCLLLILMSACNVSRDMLPVIDIEAVINTEQQIPDFSLNDIVELVDVIPIETRPDILIGSARLFYVGEEQYYIWHDDKLSLVGSNGKILNTIYRQGRGLGEYLYLSIVDVNEEKSTIRVFDTWSDKYITYSMTGVLIEEGSLNEKGVELPYFIAKDYMVMRGNGRGAYLVYITDRNMNIKRGVFPIHSILDESEHMELSRIVTIGNGGSEALVNLDNADTLYRIMSNGKLIPEAILNKGQFRLPETHILSSILSSSDAASMPYIRRAIVSSFDTYYFIDILTTNVDMISGIWNKTDGKLLAYSNRRNGFDQFGFRLSFPSGGETRVSSFYFDGDNIAFIVDAIDVVGAVEDVRETDNPVIVIAKLKEQHLKKQLKTNNP